MSKVNKNPARILSWDIETTHLKADFGTMLCVGYKWLHEKTVHVPSITDYPDWQKNMTDESRLLKDFKKVYESADMLVTYFGKGFDVKFLQAKFLEHGLGVAPNIPHVDLFYTVKANFALSRKSLQNVGYYLDLNTEKTPVEGKIWRRAATGHKPSIDYIVRHCKADVQMLEELYLRLRPLVRQHPRVAARGECSACGSRLLQARGRALTSTKGERHRYQCQECGHWSTRP